MLIPCDHGDVAVWLDALQRADGTVEPEICVNQLHGDDPITSSQAKQIARALMGAADAIDRWTEGEQPVSMKLHWAALDKDRHEAWHENGLYAVVRRSDGQWDVELKGQSGDGTYETVSVPTVVATLDEAKQIAQAWADDPGLHRHR